MAVKRVLCSCWFFITPCRRWVKQWQWSLERCMKTACRSLQWDKHIQLPMATCLLFCLCSSCSAFFHSVLWHCWLGDRKDIRPVKHWVLVCWWWRFYWSVARLIAPVVTTADIILSSIKIQNGDVLVQANSDPSGNGHLNGERERVVLLNCRLVARNGIWPAKSYTNNPVTFFFGWPLGDAAYPGMIVKNAD